MTDTHYLGHLARAGDRRPIVAAEDIVSESGMKLLAAGRAVNSQLLEHLLQHKLLRPIDESVMVADAVGNGQLRDLARARCDEDALLRQLVREPQRDRLVDMAFTRMKLPSALRNKLTVMQEAAPGMLAHSLEVTVISVFLGEQMGFDSREQGALAIAGLMHDIGQLHTDPRLIDRRVRADAPLRRQLRSHPVIGYQILHSLEEVPPVAARAVLEHHERSDGSGYPKALTGAAISRHGHVLSFAELCNGVASHAGLEHLTHVIKTYSEQFLPEVARAFWRSFDAPAEDPAYPFDDTATADCLAALEGLEARWRSDTEGADLPRSWRAVPIAFEAVHHALNRAGVNQLEAGFTEADDIDRREVCSVLVEGLRQINECCRQVEAFAALERSEAPPAALEWLREAIDRTDTARYRRSPAG